MSSIEIYEYDAYVTFSEIGEEEVYKIQSIFSGIGVEVDVGPTHLEFTYAGRDRGRKLVRALGEASKFIIDAVGEVLCEPDAGGFDPVFEFYQIESGNLYVQKGRVVRGKRELVCRDNQEV